MQWRHAARSLAQGERKSTLGFVADVSQSGRRGPSSRHAGVLTGTPSRNPPRSRVTILSRSG